MKIVLFIASMCFVIFGSCSNNRSNSENTNTDEDTNSNSDTDTDTDSDTDTDGDTDTDSDSDTDTDTDTDTGTSGNSVPNFGICPNPMPQGMVYCEDFEDGNEQDTYGTNYQEYHNIFTGSTEVVTNNCHQSTYCLRGNIGNDGTLDEITGEPGAINPHAEIGLGDVNYGSTSNFDLTTIDTNQIFISWWIKFDQDSLENLPLGCNHKMLYTNNEDSEN